MTHGEYVVPTSRQADIAAGDQPRRRALANEMAAGSGSRRGRPPIGPTWLVTEFPSGPTVRPRAARRRPWANRRALAGRFPESGCSCRCASGSRSCGQYAATVARRGGALPAATLPQRWSAFAQALPLTDPVSSTTTCSRPMSWRCPAGISLATGIRPGWGTGCSISATSPSTTSFVTRRRRAAAGGVLPQPHTIAGAAAAVADADDVRRARRPLGGSSRLVASYLDIRFALTRTITFFVFFSTPSRAPLTRGSMTGCDAARGDGPPSGSALRARIVDHRGRRRAGSAIAYHLAALGERDVSWSSATI